MIFCLRTEISQVGPLHSLHHKKSLLTCTTRSSTSQVNSRIHPCNFDCNNISSWLRKHLLGALGGSAADAQHLAAEFSGRFYKDRKALPAEALHCNTSYLTAVANDYSYDIVYARLIEGIGTTGDVLIGLSTSGNSKNIVRAFEVAQEIGITTVGFTGVSGGLMKANSDYLFNVPSSDTPRIQEAHILIGHIICQLVEEKYFAN
ncbi:MAG: SIS domain-containing protein [Sphingobacteriales bacterium]|nr:MAG: SIS domain-containing protein [Sphingobacteriales bacterium]